MPKILCVCGTAISLSQIPDPHLALAISDVIYDEWSGQIDSEELYREFNLVVLCPACGRLHIFGKTLSRPARIYRPESDADRITTLSSCVERQSATDGGRKRE